MDSLLIISLQMLAAIVLDKFFGEFPKWHPLVGFGNLANMVEARFNYSSNVLANENVAKQNPKHIAFIIKCRGAASCLALVLPLPLLLLVVSSSSLMYLLLETFILYLAIGQKSLGQHAMQILTPLAAGDLTQARHYTSYIVSRDTTQLSETEMSRATVESVLENGHDGVLASLFYFLIGGAPLVILHRLVNTLDAMWGYRTVKFIHFGWFSAKLDDFIGFFSAIFSSILYLTNGNKLHHLVAGLNLAWQQSADYKSKNGGLCMSAGAQTLGITLGGVAIYHGQETTSVVLGKGRPVKIQDISNSIKLVNRSVNTLLAISLFIGLIMQVNSVSMVITSI